MGGQRERVRRQRQHVRQLSLSGGRSVSVRKHNEESEPELKACPASEGKP